MLEIAEKKCINQYVDMKLSKDGISRPWSRLSCGACRLIWMASRTWRGYSLSSRLRILILSQSMEWRVSTAIRASRFRPCTLHWFDQRSTQVSSEEYWRHSIHNITGVLLMRVCASHRNIEVNLNLIVLNECLNFICWFIWFHWKWKGESLAWHNGMTVICLWICLWLDKTIGINPLGTGLLTISDWFISWNVKLLSQLGQVFDN